MPRTTNGKLDRDALQRRYLPADTGSPGSAAPPEAPAAPVPADFVLALRQALEHHPGGPVLQEGTSPLSASGVLDRSAALALALQARGVAAGDRVVVLMPRSATLVVATVAVLRCGAVYVPLDPELPAARREALLAQVEPRLCLTLPGAEALCATWPAWPLPAEQPAATDLDLRAPPWPTAQPDAVACLLFTSGTTGAPKGVCVTREGLHRLVIGGSAARLAPGQRWGFCSSPSFDAAHLEVWGPLLNQGVCVVLPAGLVELDELAQFLARQRIGHAWLTASLFNALVDHDVQALAGLEQLLIGGERLSVPHVARAMDAHPQLHLVNGYGPTENTTFSTCHPIQPADLADPAGIPIGQPITGTMLHLDPLPGSPDEGELWVGGRGLAAGYWRQPEATAKRFVQRDGQRWYRTGDRVSRRGDGIWLYRGRLDRQVKLQGHRLELDEVERHLASCPGVLEVAVFVVGDAAHTQRLAAAYTCGTPTPAPQALQTQLRQHLPEAALPRLFMPMAAMPRNRSGKIDRTALNQQLQARLQLSAPDTAAAPQAPAAPAPDGAADAALPTLATLSALWRECLGLGAAVPLDEQSDFSTLGGTSISALRLAAAIKRQLGVSCPAIQLLRHPRMSQHLALVGQAHSAPPDDGLTAPAPRPGETQGLLTRVQQAVFTAGALDDEAGRPNNMLLHVALVATQRLPTARLQTAFEALSQRHPMLRCAARLEGQAVRSWLLPALPEGWWTAHEELATAPQDLAWPEPLLDRLNRPLDSARTGPMRVDCWPLAQGGTLLVWSVLHHVIDEASIHHTLGELDALLRGEPLPPVTGSPLAWLAFERAWTDTAAIAHHARLLAGQLDSASLPLDIRQGPADERPLHLPADVSAGLLEACGRWHVTPFVPLLAACGNALQALWGPALRWVSTPFSRRTEPQLEQPVAYGLDLRLLEAGCQPQETPLQQLQRVHRLTLDAQQPGFLPLHRLVEATAATSPNAARLLGHFSLTWRHDPVRTLPWGGGSARLIRVPQRGPRFALALHAAQIDGQLHFALEGVRDVFEQGWDARFAHALAEALRTLCAQPAWIADAPADAEADAPAALDALTIRHLEAAWCRATTHSPAHPTPAQDFLACGGTSLSAMRMSAQIRRELSARLELGAFLAQPSWAALIGQVARALATPAQETTAAMTAGRHAPWPSPTQTPPAAAAPPSPQPMVHAPMPVEIWEDQPGQPLILLLPGQGGHSVGLLTLVTALRQTLGGRVGIAVPDLARSVQDTPDISLAVLRQQLAALVAHLGVERIGGLTGFSLGGQLALQLTQDVPALARTPVTLIDTFAAHRLPHVNTSWWRRVERRLARTWWLHRHPRPADPAPIRPAPADPQTAATPEDPAVSARWTRLLAELAGSRPGSTSPSVQLLQACAGEASAEMLWRRSTNGLARGRLPGLYVVPVVAEHLEMVQRAAPQVACHIAAQWFARHP